MKNLILLLATLLLALFSNAQIVNIPDTNFRAALIAHNPVIDTDGDGEIQVNEASSYSGTLNIAIKNISDLTGIEAFTALTSLVCFYNQFTTIDLSNNIALTYLDCGGDVQNHFNSYLTSLDLSNNINLTYLNCRHNPITTLNISNNINLTYIDCHYNQLSTLDINNKPALTYLDCSSNNITSLDLSNDTSLTYIDCLYNQLSTLDVSNNVALSILYCSVNQLIDLDLRNNISLTSMTCDNNQLNYFNIKNGNNINLTYFYASYNSNLYCIEVDDSSYSAINWTDIDPQSYFSEDCTTSKPDEFQTPQLSIFPNPTTGLITIQAENINRIEVMDLQGQSIIVIASETKQSDNTNEIAAGDSPRNDVIDLSTQPQGIYIIKVTTDKQTITQKIIKQ